MRNSTKGIAAEIAKGAFRPHTALTNMALSYFQNPGNYFAKSIFPICPVDLSSDNYYVFDKADLFERRMEEKTCVWKGRSDGCF